MNDFDEDLAMARIRSEHASRMHELNEQRHEIEQKLAELRIRELTAQLEELQRKTNV